MDDVLGGRQTRAEAAVHDERRACHKRGVVTCEVHGAGATSSAVPIRPSACNRPADARAAAGSGCAWKYPSARPASMYPGQMQFTRMPSLPWSIAMALVSAIIPALVAQ